MSGPTAIPPRYFDDFKVGDVIDLGHHTITKDEIIAFARQFDPQSFHLDEEAAARTMFGGLIASGWHTGSLMMRLLYEGAIKHSVSLGSPGIDEMRWVRPVRPGDTLSARMTRSSTPVLTREPGRPEAARTAVP